MLEFRMFRKVFGKRKIAVFAVSLRIGHRSSLLIWMEQPVLSVNVVGFLKVNERKVNEDMDICDR